MGVGKARINRDAVATIVNDGMISVLANARNDQWGRVGANGVLTTAAIVVGACTLHFQTMTSIASGRKEPFPALAGHAVSFNGAIGVLAAGVLVVGSAASTQIDSSAVLAIAGTVLRIVSRVATAEVWALGILQALGVSTATSVVDPALIDDFAALFAKEVARRALVLNQCALSSLADL